MKEFNLAAIDVGSNAARLLIKTVSIDLDGRLSQRKALFLRVPLRLGMEVFKKGKISREKEEAFLRTMKAYRQLMKVFKVRDYRACATSAMRDAKNGRQVMDRVNETTGLGLKIISGDEESQIIYDIHLSQLQDDNNYLYVDVGGGSTEVTFISQGQRVMSHSYNIGTVRMLSEAVKAEELQHVRNGLGKVAAGYGDITIIGSGGNINKLYRIAPKRDKTEGRLPVDTLVRLHDRLAKMSLQERMDVFNMKPDRADVIVPAAEIFMMVAQSVGAKAIKVPNVGLADGLINDMAQSIVFGKKRA
ncbi:MAG: Ppx/GppA family phosphatase [Prevotella sp.]|nr:Ppx/GppA family phosphatase [Bacteroidales bacterium]MCI6101658.1 Ppx/GppA family phosphatase [Bacteroidales bacterium]MDY4956206.1 Ppx/GppA family phosphatase [Prevotella sp.]